MKNIEKDELLRIESAFNSMLRADYLSVYDIPQLVELESYYVDFYHNLTKILQNQDNYIKGRRGTGKTALLMRSYYECYKSLIDNNDTLLGDRKILPIYIDLAQCQEIFGNADNDVFERTFIIKLLDEIIHQLSHFKFADKRIITSKLETVKVLITNGNILSKQKTAITSSETSEENGSCGIDFGLDKMEFGAKIEGKSIKNETSDIQEVRGTSIRTLIDCLGEIRTICKLNAIYIFIDEFSDLKNEQQLRFSLLLKKLLGSKNNIYFKLGVITDRFIFSESIRTGRDIFPISLDLSDFIDTYGGVKKALNELQNFVEEIIDKRLHSYGCHNTVDDIIPTNHKQILERINVQSLGVPRTLGLILTKSFSQAQMKDEPIIGIKEINIGIKETRKTYFSQFSGAVAGKYIPAFYMDMWNSILQKAVNEKQKFADRPASHFLIDPIRKKYLNILCENFLIHLLEDNRASKYGGNYTLYSIDYDICQENNIKYATEKDEFTAVRFIYNDVLTPFDAYFSSEQLKSYRCPKCKKIYPEQELIKMKVKRCFECDEIMEEIIHKPVEFSYGNLTEIEIKILGCIAELSKSHALSASEIANSVGCSHQKVSKYLNSNVLSDKVFIAYSDGHNLYYGKGEVEK